MRRPAALRALLPLALLLPFLVAAESGVTTPPSPVADTSLAGPTGSAVLCDALDDLHCLLPFPSDRFTVPDARTATGRRVQLDVASVPRNVAGKPIDTTEWNRQDGWSPGQALLTYVPGLDLHRTWGDPDDHITEIGRELEPGSPMVVVNTRTGERHPFWSELDTHPDTTDDQRLLIIRPAVNWEEGTRYVVALRNLRDSDGNLIPADETFAAYRDGRAPTVPDPAFEARRPAMETIFTDLRSAGIARDDLYLAWDFTVASADDIAGRVLHIRDESLAALGDLEPGDGVVEGDPPTFTITAVEDHIDSDGTRSGTGRTVRGSVTVPNYLTPPQDETRVEVAGEGQQAPGSRFNYADPTGYTDPTAMPVVNPQAPTTGAPFVCTIPGSAFPEDPNHAGPSRVSLYGHGLLGSRGESEGSSANGLRLGHNYTHCAIDWEGMSFEDAANVVTILADVSNFPTLADRAQQGFLNWLILSRAIVHPDGFASDPAFLAPDGTPLIDGSTLVYDGNSQGGIMGGALLALSVDLTRGTLGVTGMNYSTLLNRSHDWEGPLVDPQDPDIPSYSSALYTAYPSKVEQQLIFGLIQMLWDRAEANGFAAHMTDHPYPHTPAHQVLLHVGYGDLQVANVSAEVEARTVGAYLLGASVPARHWAWSADDGDPHVGLPDFPQRGFIEGGSALVYWDSGHPTPFNGNVPPDGAYGDPHEHPRRDPLAALQKAIFYETGRIVDVFAPRTFGGRFQGTPYRTCRFPVTADGQPNPELGDDLSYGTRDAYCPSY